MRATDTVDFISKLVGDPNIPPKPKSQRPLAVKICGTRTPEAAKAAIEAGADSIGIILAPGRTRTVSDEVALQIAHVVRTTPKASPPLKHELQDLGASDFFDYASQSLVRPDRAQLVGVFAGVSLEDIISQVYKLNLDVVQLHGSEPIEFARSIPVPVIRKFSPAEQGLSARGYHDLPLLDAGAGGTGQRLDLQEVRALFSRDPDVRVMFAGGLTPDNVQAALQALGPYKRNIAGVDVSSGVEEGGAQSIDKITRFIRAVKG